MKISSAIRCFHAMRGRASYPRSSPRERTSWARLVSCPAHLGLFPTFTVERLEDELLDPTGSRYPIWLDPRIRGPHPSYVCDCLVERHVRNFFDATPICPGELVVCKSYIYSHCHPPPSLQTPTQPSQHPWSRLPLSEGPNLETPLHSTPTHSTPWGRVTLIPFDDAVPQ